MHHWFMMSDEETPDPKLEEAIQEFYNVLDSRKDELVEIGKEDEVKPDKNNASRFVRARKLDPAKAVEQYIAMHKWRKENNVDGMLDEDDPDEAVYTELCPHRNHKFDKHGRPLYIERTGLISVPKLLKRLSPEKIIRRHIRQMEKCEKRLKEISERTGKYHEKQVIILDLAHLSLLPNSTAISCFKETIRIDQEYYPERLGQLFIINAPWIFTPCWALIKPFLDPATKEKFKVMGGSYQSTLIEAIGEDELPAMYGGKCECETGCVWGLDPHGVGKNAPKE